MFKIKKDLMYPFFRKGTAKKRPPGSFRKFKLVELPDTASGSGLSLGRESTCIVFCFVLASSS